MSGYNGVASFADLWAGNGVVMAAMPGLKPEI